MHCPTYLHIWMQLKSPLSLFLQLLLSSPVGPVNHGNNKGKSIDSVATLSTVLVEPTYLQQISNATFADADMKKFIELAQGLSPNFWIVHRGGVPLVVQCHDSREQIVFPSSGGFQTLEPE